MCHCGSELVLFLRYCMLCFKQKTAYEMRISDWSSDVCSSDLISSCRSNLARKLRASSGRGALRRGRRLHTALDAQWHARGSDRRCGAAMGGLHLCLKIGRASCRERVCQYVEL